MRSPTPTSMLPLAPGLQEAILNRLGFQHRPEPTRESLNELYRRWCERVPFDNIRKLIHVRRGDPSPLPGTTPEDFFSAWLQYGVGGTCWAGAGAWHALLTSLGFHAERGVATMLVVPDLPPNHGTVRVRLDSQDVLVDCSILHGEPLPLIPNTESVIAHPAWGVRCSHGENRWSIRWRALHRPDGFDCRCEHFGVSQNEFAERYDQTRGWSPFNYQLTARRNRGDEVVGLAFGQSVRIRADGGVEQRELLPDERSRILIEEIGIREELVAQLPPDVPTPPPPGSQTAQAAASRPV